MARFNQTELAQIVKRIINELAGNPIRFYAEFRGVINSGLKSLSKNDLTENELRERGLKSAENFCESVRNISLDSISSKLSEEIIHLAAAGNIEPDNPYFLKSAKDRIKEYIKLTSRYTKKQIRKK